MTRKGTTRKNAKRGTATWIPKTIKASKRIGQSTMKSVRFLLNRTKQALVKLPGRVDHATSKRLRSYTKSRQRR
jgi:hypothetical protein